MSSLVAQYLEKKYRAHAKEHGLDPAKLPALPPAPKKAPSPKDAVVVGKGPGQSPTLGDAVAKVKPGGLIVVLPGQHQGGGPIKTNKPFRLVGHGAASTAVLFRVKGDEDCLALEGKSQWKLSGVALLAELAPKAKRPCADIVLAQQGAEVALEGCVLAGAPVRFEKNGVCVSGAGLRAYQGAKASAVDSLLAFNHWNVAVHDGRSAVSLNRCALFAGVAGVFVGVGGAASVSGGEARRNRFGMKLYGDDASIEAKNVRIEDQLMTGVFVEKGRARLERCSILDNGGHGVGAEAGTEIVVQGCKVRENWESGFWIGGKATLDGNEISDNVDHGVLFEAESRGRASHNRCRKNGGFGILRDPSAKVALAGNDTKDNARDGEYVLGTLAKSVQRAFPKGVQVPEALAKLARYQEEHGRLTGETMYVAPGPLTGWDGVGQEFAVFGTGPDGSTVAFWLRRGLGIGKAPVVYLDSEGVDNLVLAETFEGFLSILAAGRDDLRWDEELEPDIDDEDEHEAFCRWLKEELGVVPAKKISKLRKAAEAKHPGLHQRLLATLAPTRG